MAEILSRFRAIFLYVGIFSLFVNILLLLPPVYSMMLFDRVIPNRSVMTLVVLTVGIVVALLIMMLLEYLRSRLLIAIGAELDHVLGPKVLDSLLRGHVSPDQGSSNATLGDITVLRTFLAGYGVFALFDAPWLPIYLGIIYLFSPELGLFALLGAVALVVIGYINERLTRAPINELQASTAKATRFAYAAFRNAEVIRGIGMAKGIGARWDEFNAKAVEHHVRSSIRTSFMAAVTRFARQAVQMGMMGAGVYLLIDQNTSPGVLLAATFIVSRAMSPVEQLIGSWTLLAEARHAYLRLKAQIEITPEEQFSTVLPAPVGRINVEQLVFSVQHAGRPIIRGISFEIKQGESVGLIGPSASGKSTLARLLLGIWSPTAGVVRLDGADIATWSRDNLGPYVGYLPQDIELFAGTIAENIARMGKMDSEAVISAAMRSHAHDMILRLPKGYDTEIGEGGAVLSGGQRQRLALARALYGNPRFVVLDEPNSNLDTEGEDALIQTLRELKRDNVTVVVIAHRPTLFSCFDRLLVLRDGMIEAYGAREDILRRFTAPAPIEAVAR